MTTYHKLAILVAALLAITVSAFPGSWNAITWTCIESVRAVERMSHISRVSLDRFDPTCPQCM